MLGLVIDNVNGLDIAKKIREKDTSAIIIFLTNYDKYVYDAFEVEKFAKKLGYPIVTKPLNGGGGRGIQVFNDDQEVQKLINTGE